MITRREFLFNSAAGLFIAASPKIIVDMGANAFRPYIKDGYVYFRAQEDLPAWSIVTHDGHLVTTKCTALPAPLAIADWSWKTGEIGRAIVNPSTPVSIRCSYSFSTPPRPTKGLTHADSEGI